MRSASTAAAVLKLSLADIRAKTVSCRQCGNTWPSYEEKETDVNIAVSTVADAAAGASDLGGRGHLFKFTL